MNFESQSHELVPVADAMEAATWIKQGRVHGYEALQWAANGHTFTVVADNHCDNQWAEVAFLRDDQQVESITAAWINSIEELAQYFVKAQTSDFTMGNKGTLIIGKPKGHETASFECGCCGNGFEGNVAEQLKYGQDAGYGICANCSHYYN